MTSITPAGRVGPVDTAPRIRAESPSLAAPSPMAASEGRRPRPCRLPVGATRLGLCPSCHGETYLERVDAGWRCPDCGHVNQGRFRAPIRQRRTVDARLGIALCEAGLSYHAAAKRVGCSATALKEAMARAGYTPPLHRPTNPGPGTSRRTANVPRELLDAYPDVTVAEIAERAGVSFATAYRRVREHRGGELAPTDVWRRRPQVQATVAASDARCARAAAMRAEGRKWLEIAIAVGYASDLHAMSAVRRWRQRHAEREADAS